MRGKHRGAFSPGRQDDEGGGDDSSRWLGTYGDAITLLMAFFVMLYAMSEVDATKFEAFVRGLQDPFGNSAASDGMFDAQPALVGDSGNAVPAETLADLTAGMPPVELPPPVPRDPAEEVEEGELDPDDLPASDDLDQLEVVQAAIAESLTAAGLGDLASFRFDGRGLVLSLATDNVLFASGSTEISDLGRDLIAAVAEPLASFDNGVFVEGHTDDVPIAGRPGYTNWNLSTDRAVAVVSLLATEHDVDQDRLGAAGYAEFRPRVPNTNDRNRSTNRRVDVLVVAEGVDLDG